MSSPGSAGGQFDADAGFKGAQFKTTTRLGPLRANILVLDGASFGASIVVEVAAARLSLVGARFEQEATLWVRYADVVLDAAGFTKPASLSFAETPFTLRVPVVAAGQDLTLDETPLEQARLPAQPRLLSLRRVDTSNLVLGDLDLAWCLFRGAHNLDKLRIGGPKHFGTTPKLAF